MERTLRLTLEYDGAGFVGWARQPDRRSVEGTIAAVLESLFPGSCATLAVAGRTDAGVHATHQVVSAEVADGPPTDRLSDALSSRLPPDIAVVAATEARAGFHARYAALARSYEYRVLARRPRSPMRAAHTLHHATPIDRGVLDACAALVVGEHDFRAFTPAETPGERTRRHVAACAWRARGDELVFAIEAGAFLHHMVRTLVGTMLEAARGARDIASFGRLLGGSARDTAGPTAPAHALTLTGVRYAGDGPGSDQVLCFVTRERGGARELLVLDQRDVPRGTFEPEERIDAVAHREVRSRTGVELVSVPRTLGQLIGPDASRTRVVWLRAGEGLPDRWEHGPARTCCAFTPLSVRLAPELDALLARVAAAS